MRSGDRKAADEREENQASLSSPEREQARAKLNLALVKRRSRKFNNSLDLWSLRLRRTS